MDKPLISIIIPTYNTAAYIENGIKSVLNQTYENIELIVINDGSTDNSKDLLNLLHHHLDLYEKYTKIELQLKRPLHRFFKIYIKNFKGAKDLRIKLANTKSIDEIRKILEDFEKISFKKETSA